MVVQGSGGGREIWVKPFWDEIVLDEIVFSIGRNCFWMIFFGKLDESVPTLNNTIAPP